MSSKFPESLIGSCEESLVLESLATNPHLWQGSMGRVHHRDPQNSYHRSPPHEDAGKAEHWESQKQTESPKMRRQRKNPQLKGMEDSPVKELNAMEASKLSDTKLKKKKKEWL